MYGNYCFETSMRNVTIEDECDCHLECDAISYTYYYVSSPFDPDEMCPRKVVDDDFLMKQFYINPMPPQLLRKMEYYAFNKTMKQNDICRTSINYKAEVIFRLATNTMSVTVSSRRLSFFDKLSGFGKLFILRLKFHI